MPKRTLTMVLFLSLYLLAFSEKKTIPEKPGYFSRGTLQIISSSHQDIAWMDSPQACEEYRDKQCITPALEMMEKNPDYCFVMENMLNLREYLGRHPERRSQIERFTRAGRLEWGASYTQPYESLLAGEQLIRQTYFGRRWLNKNFPGCDARVYFNPDVPGRSLQMQQILAKAGIPYMVISRFHEGLWRWASPDGSSVLAYSPGHYTNASALLNATPAEGDKGIARKLAQWEDYYRQRDLAPAFPLLNSVDFSRPTDFTGLISLWNRGAENPATAPLPRLGYSSARVFFETISRNRPRFDTVQGERPNLWLYIHGPTHHWAISAQREAGWLLPAAETFSTVRALLSGSFRDYPARELEEAWQASAYPDHGWGGKEGQITDRLFRKKYEFARDTGRRILQNSLQEIAAQVRCPAGKGIPLVVFNTLSWQRSDPVVCLVRPETGSYHIVDEQGQPVAHQVLPAQADQPVDVRRLEFIARDVPAVGYRTWYLVNGQAAGEGVAEPGEGGYFENSFFRVELAPGGIRSLYDKELGRNILKTDKFLGGEVFTMRSVGNGAGEFGRVQQPTMEGFAKLSQFQPSWRWLADESGPVKSVWQTQQPLANCIIREKLVFYNEIKRLDCLVSILGWDGDPYREFRLAFPVEPGRVAYDVPLGVVEVGKDEIPLSGGPAYGSLIYDEPCSQIRPREVQNFLNASNAISSVTLATDVTVNDFQDPTSDPVSYPLLQAVLLASRRSCHREGNWYLQEGDHHYRFSLFSHQPGWEKGYRQALQSHASLQAVVASRTTGKGELPESMSLLTITPGHVLLSTLKKCEDDDALIIRLVEMEGRDAKTECNFFVPLRSAEKVNIIEEEGRPIPVSGKKVKLVVGHQAIETIKLWPKSKQAQ